MGRSRRVKPNSPNSKKEIKKTLKEEWDDQCKSFIHSLLKDVSIIYLICKKSFFFISTKLFRFIQELSKEEKKSIDRSIDLQI